MSIDVKQTLEEIGRLEKLQAQIELRATQLKDDEKKLRDKLKTLGITPSELEQKITELEATIDSKLTLIRSLDKPMGGIPSGKEDSIQI